MCAASLNKNSYSIAQCKDIRADPEKASVSISRTILLWLTLMLVLVDMLESQTVPWIIDTVPVYTPNTRNTLNYVDLATTGACNYGKSSGLPTPNGEVFTCAFCWIYGVIDDVRVFDRYGKALFGMSSDNFGPASAFVKADGGSTSVVTSTYFSKTQPNFLKVQPVSILNGLFASSGAPVTSTAYKLQVVMDQVGTTYFYGANECCLARYSTTDGSQLVESDAVGGTDSYAYRIYEVPALNAVFAYFASNAGVGLFSATNLNILGSKLIDSSTDQIIQSVSDSTVFWNLRSPDDLNTVIQRRQFDGSPEVFALQGTSSLLAFYEGSLAQLPGMGLILVSPYHTDKWSNSMLRGSVFLVREDTLSVVSYQTPQNWLVMRMSLDFSHSATEDGGRRFYMLFSDAATQNVHSYYLLVDRCMSVVDGSLSCADCPTGYWRAGGSFAAPRRCVAPTQFPTATGMDNATLTYETCRVARCRQCTFDASRCAGCDVSGGYFLRSETAADRCQTKAEMGERFGVDASGTRVVPCADPHCLDCRDRFDVCVACDTQAAHFLLQQRCVAKSSLLQGQGVDPSAGSVRRCSQTGCIDCFDDFAVCVRCDTLQNLYLDADARQCVRPEQFAPDSGADLRSGTVRKCADSLCSDCRADYKECVQCRSAELYIFNGVCKSFSGPDSPKVIQNRFYTDQMTAEVIFDQPISVNFTQNFFKAFTVVVEDLIRREIHECTASKTPMMGFRCSFIVNEKGFKILFETEHEITIGKLVINPILKPASDSSHLILARMSNEPFGNYPIVIEGFSSERANLINFSAKIISRMNFLKPYFNILLALISLSLSVLFDKYIVTLEYLSLLEGPLLAYPQQVFEIVLQISNYLPLEYLPHKDVLFVFRGLSDCEPSSQFATQDYECSVLGNIGPDTFAAVILALVCLLITVVCNKIIENRIKEHNRAITKDSLGNGKSLPSTVRKLAQIMNETRSSSKSDSITNLVLRKGSPKILRHTVQDSKSSAKTSQEISFLPSAKSPSVGTNVASFWFGARDIYGVSFFLVKLEANQLKVIMVVFLNYWNYNQGNLEQYSLIAAIIFTLYYIFQGYFTYQFAGRIWKEASKLNQLDVSRVGVEKDSTQIPQSQPKIMSKTTENKKKSVLLRVLLPEMIVGPHKDVRANWFDEVRLPDKFYKLCAPLVSLVRCLLISALLVMLSNWPSAQVIFAIIVEIAYLVFIIKGAKPVSLYRFSMQVVSGSLVCGYLGMKLATLMMSLTEEQRQRTVGWWMACTLALYMFCGISVLVVEVFKYIYTKLKSCRKRRVSPQVVNSSAVKTIHSGLPASNVATTKILEGCLSEVKTSSSTQQVQTAQAGAKLAKTAPTLNVNHTQASRPSAQTQKMN